MKKTVTAIAAAAAAVLALTACAGGDQTTGTDAGSPGDTIVIGSADFAESRLIATIYSIALQDAGVEVREHFDIGSREVYVSALQDGSIDLIPEYAGALLKYLKPDATESASDEVLGALADALPDGLTHLEPSEAENKDTLTVTAETAQELELTTISSLVPHAGGMALGGPPEWLTRSNGVPGLEEVYALQFREYVTLDAGGPLTIGALLSGQIQAANVFSTDPAIEADDLVVLEDDKSLFPAENVVPVIVESKSDATIAATLDAISAALTTDDLLDMNARIADGEDVRDVAQSWLDAEGL